MVLINEDSLGGIHIRLFTQIGKWMEKSVWHGEEQVTGQRGAYKLLERRRTNIFVNIFVSVMGIFFKYEWCEVRDRRHRNNAATTMRIPNIINSIKYRTAER